DLSGSTQWGAVQDNTVFGLTNGQEYTAQFATVKYVTAADDRQHPVIAYSDAQSVTVSNEKVSEVKVWAYRNALHVDVPSPTTLSVYTISGTLYRKQSLAAGQTVLSLPQGLYIIRTGNTSKKVFVR
ncbi:MAG: T9SS type A sorting domain-containing protein, partial [Tannerella sp.]|nr:T9SS type A sorting domain-containing protein [Tannerella sp.]